MSTPFVLLEDHRKVAEARSDLVVPWWSFSKVILAATALRLADQGRLSLSDKVEGHVIEDLLRHQSGLRDYGGIAAYHRAVAAGEPPWSRDELIARVDTERLFAPGQAWSYSNLGYLLVRELIEQIHGGDLGEAARALIFAPLGVEDARFARMASDLDDVEMGAARGYDPGWVYHGLFAGPLTAAAQTLDRLFAADSPLSEASLARLQDRRDLPEHNRKPWALSAYGLGVMCPDTLEGWTAVGHTGGGPGSVVAVYRRSGARQRTAAVFALGEDQGAVETSAVELLQVGAS